MVFYSRFIFLDTDVLGNSRDSRRLTGQLYGGDSEYRLKQEIILGRGGLKMIKALGYKNIKKIHLNEGHGSLAAIELLVETAGKNNLKKIQEIRKKIIFTTHTPILAGQDIFPLNFILRYQPDFPICLKKIIAGRQVNFTELGMYFSGYINAVSRRHQKTAQKLFPDYKIRAITNGVNSIFWAAPEFQKIYDKYIPGWRSSGDKLSQAAGIPLAAINSAHRKEKKRLFNFINKKQNEKLDEKVFTLVFARRFTSYKRPMFLFEDLKRLAAISDSAGCLQIIYAGKAHPQDSLGRELIKQIYRAKKKLAGRIKVVFLEDYDLAQAKLLVAGADLWLNTPLSPNEASGTSGMKAAHNGVSQLSVLDGWWPEGYIKNETGWAIDPASSRRLYDLLEKEILPIYYRRPDKWLEIMRRTIVCNASFFNTDRVLKQYIAQAYRTVD